MYVIYIGIGSLWEYTGVTGPRGSNCPYYGQYATIEYNKLSSCNTSIPTENDYARDGGTFCTHWDETCMRNELMTGVLENNNSSTYPLSRISIAGLQDLGYTVDYRQAERFTSDDIHSSCRCNNNNRNRRQVRQQFRSNGIDKKDNNEYNHHDHTVHQFGVSTEVESTHGSNTPPGRRRRRISDEAYQIAVSYGLDILSLRRTEYIGMLKQQEEVEQQDSVKVSSNMKATKTKFIGDQIISILVEDEGEIYGIMVTNPDFQI